MDGWVFPNRGKHHSQMFPLTNHKVFLRKRKSGWIVNLPAELSAIGTWVCSPDVQEKVKEDHFTTCPICCSFPIQSYKLWDDNDLVGKCFGKDRVSSHARNCNQWVLTSDIHNNVQFTKSDHVLLTPDHNHYQVEAKFFFQSFRQQLKEVTGSQ